MLRILHSVSYMRRAGIETMLMNYYRNIDRTKIQFDFLCNSQIKGDYDDEIIDMGGRIFRTPGFNPLNTFKYKRYMEDLFKENDYKIIESHNDAMAAYALAAGYNSNIPIRIFHAHSTNTPVDYKYPIKILCKNLIKYFANRYICCGLKAGEYYFPNNIIKSKDFHCIPNAINIDDFLFNEDKRNEIRSKYNLTHKKIIGHVGRFSTPKNHEFLVEVFAETLKKDPSVYLVLVGEGELMSKVRSKVKSLGIEKDVLFVGSVPNTCDWYQVFDLFFMPSLHEGVPVVGIEAQSSDLPCLYSTSVTPEVNLLKNQKVQFLDLQIPKSVWSSKILEMLNNKNTRTNNYDIITKNHYNIKEEAKNLQKLYTELANGI